MSSHRRYVPILFVLSLAFLPPARNLAAAEGFVVIVPAASAVESISKDDLSKLFLKQATVWPGGGGNVLPADLEGSCAGRTAGDNQTVRNVFVIGPDKKIKLVIAYPMSTGRNFDEVLRVIDSLQLTAKHKVATPVNWKQGEDVIILGSVTDDEAKKTYPQGWKAPRPYLRIVPHP